MLTVEQIVAAQRANVETLFGLTHKAFEGVEKIVELNLTASKAALSEASGHTQTMLSVKDAQELLALQSGLLQPLMFVRVFEVGASCQMVEVRVSCQV